MLMDVHLNHSFVQLKTGVDAKVPSRPLHTISFSQSHMCTRNVAGKLCGMVGGGAVLVMCEVHVA